MFVNVIVSSLVKSIVNAFANLFVKLIVNLIVNSIVNFIGTSITNSIVNMASLSHASKELPIAWTRLFLIRYDAFVKLQSAKRTGNNRSAKPSTVLKNIQQSL